MAVAHASPVSQCGSPEHLPPPGSMGQAGCNYDGSAMSAFMDSLDGGDGRARPPFWLFYSFVVPAPTLGPAHQLSDFRSASTVLTVGLSLPLVTLSCAYALNKMRSFYPPPRRHHQCWMGRTPVSTSNTPPSPVCGPMLSP